ncbi:MAG TPA: DUF4476 domain-containing protein [Flavobacterium sp.]|nr:DUF4476 domain-containing protein [Flavobacterium sp.]
MKRIYFTIAFSFIAAFSFAQVPTGNLTVFSEDGDPFYLILNGEKQNDVPQTNIRVEDLNQPYYNAKIIFEDKSLIEITKGNLAITDIDGEYKDVTYKIKRDKNKKNKLKLNFFSEGPVDRRFVAPPNVHVVHYGAPQPVAVSQTTTTTTVGNTGIGMGVNLGGVSMNVNVNGPSGVYTETTTTTTSHSGQQIAVNSNPGRPRGCSNRLPMNSSDFNSALASVKSQNFDETKLKVAKQIVQANCLDVNQIKQLANTIIFEDIKLDFAKFAYDYCTDRNKYFQLNDIFAFSTNVDDLTEYIKNR